MGGSDQVRAVPGWSPRSRDSAVRYGCRSAFSCDAGARPSAVVDTRDDLLLADDSAKAWVSGVESEMSCIDAAVVTSSRLVVVIQDLGRERSVYTPVRVYSVSRVVAGPQPGRLSETSGAQTVRADTGRLIDGRSFV